MKNFLIFGIVILSLVTLVQAQTIYQQNQGINLKIPCINNETFCSGSATCNLSIIRPDSSIFIKGEAMTNEGIYHSFALTSEESDLTGNYRVIVACDDAGEFGFSTFYYEITPSGKGDQLNYLFYVFIFISWIILILGFYLQEYAIVGTGSFFLMLIGIYVLINGLVGYKDIVTQGFGTIHLVIGFYILVRGAWEQYQNM